ncbi:hypothetical protein V6N13_001471 [Hibiscus sabdariffa]
MDNSPLDIDGFKDVLVQENVVQEGIGDIASLGVLSDVSSPIEQGVVGSKSECPRANLATSTMLNNGQVKCVRQVSEINLSFLTPVTRVVAESKLTKRGNGG